MSLVAPRASAEQMASWQINPEAPLVAVAQPAGVARAPSPEITGNAPSVMAELAAHSATPVVQSQVIPSPRESRVERMPTSQVGADIAELPVWPVRAAMQVRGRATLPRLTVPTGPTVPDPAAAARISALDGSDRWVFEDDYEERRVDGEVVPTTYFERSELAGGARPRTLLAAGAAAAAIALIVGYALHASSTGALPTQVATPTPLRAAASSASASASASASVAEALPAPRGRTSLPITSWPSGAVVTLVDDGAPRVLGPTPVSASLDPSHSYDVMLAVPGRAAQLRHVDLGTMHELAVDLDGDPALDKVAAHDPPVPPVVVVHLAPRPPATLAPAAPPHHHSMPHAAIVTPAFDAPSAAPRPSQVAPATGAGNGVLMVSAKPPCEIIIDGRATHLVTPQRSIPLTSGAHAVTLVNVSVGIKKTIAVKVDAKKPTKVIQDFTKG